MQALGRAGNGICESSGEDDMSNTAYDVAPPSAYTGAAQAVWQELMQAVKQYPPMNSPHEGWAVIQEELDELWDHVRAKDSDRDRQAMYREAIQVAAMGIRFAVEVGEVPRA
jgi:hypothetical protein